MNKLKCQCSPNCQACACGWSITCDCEEILKCEHEFVEYDCQYEGHRDNGARCDKCKVLLSTWKMNFGGEEPLFIPTKEFCQDCKFLKKAEKREQQTKSEERKIKVVIKCLNCFKNIEQSELKNARQKFVKGSAFGLQCTDCWQKEKESE